MRLLNSGFKKILKLSALSVLFVGGSLGAYAVIIQMTGNFHPVIPGELYRAAQPSAAQLEQYVKDNGIKTVINLRGAEAKSKWYEDEVNTSQRLGIEHIDFRMSSSAELTPQRADELVAMMRNAPKPILIHCSHGADRSGLVSVIYSHEIAGVDDEVAERQLSFYYGHVGLPYVSPTYAMDSSWQKLESHFGVKAQADVPQALKKVGS